MCSRVLHFLEGCVFINLEKHPIISLVGVVGYHVGLIVASMTARLSGESEGRQFESGTGQIIFCSFFFFYLPVYLERRNALHSEKFALLLFISTRRRPHRLLTRDNLRTSPKYIYHIRLKKNSNT